MHARIHQMETRSLKRRKLLMEAEEDSKRNIWTNFGQDDEADRISDLSNDLLHQILLLLPIKCIARTSILSKRWRFVWTSLPDLDFTSMTHQIQCEVSNTFIDEMDPITISNVLGKREKSCILRRLRFFSRLSFSRLNDLIRSAIRKNVEELDIEVITHGPFNLPRCILTSESLRVFKFKSSGPEFHLPPASILTNGFKSLRQLSLSMIDFRKHSSLYDVFIDTSFPLLKKLCLEYCCGLEHVRFSCSSLEELVLHYCFELRSLEISCAMLETLQVRRSFNNCHEAKKRVHLDGPKLQRLEWDRNSSAGTMSFENLNALQHASVAIEMSAAGNVSSLFKLLERVSHVTFLSLGYSCLEILVSRVTWLKPFNNLKSLQLHTGFSRIDVRGLSYILSKSPFVENLTITTHALEPRINKLWDMSRPAEDNYWHGNRSQFLESFLQHLKVLKIFDFGLCKGEVSFVTFLVKHAGNLEKMVFILKKRDLELREKIRIYFQNLCAHVLAPLPQIVFQLLG